MGVKIKTTHKDVAESMSAHATQIVFLKQRRKVSCFDPKTGKLVATYRSITEAAKDVSSEGSLSTRIAGISNCARGKNSKMYGYYWRFSEDVDIKIDVSSGRRKRSLADFTPEAAKLAKMVFKFSVEGKRMGVYANYTEAAKSVIPDATTQKIRVAAGSISVACREGHSKTAYGFIWRRGDSFIVPFNINRTKIVV